MSPLTAARIQMELSLGFHMIFAAIGVAMPLLMLIAEWRWIRRQDEDARRLAHVWAKLTAVTVRHRRRVGHRAVVRAGPAVAALHGASRVR